MVQDLQDRLYGSATGTRKGRFKERVEEKAVVMKHSEADGDKNFSGQERGAVSGTWRRLRDLVPEPAGSFCA